MGYLLNIFYAFVLILVCPWLFYRYWRYGKNRRGWSQKLFGLVPYRQTNRPCLWFHAVSVGEVNLLAPVLERLQRQRPDIEIVISTTTETGYDLATEKYCDTTVFFFPFDFTWAIKTALRRIRPTLVVLAELEIWPNFVRTVDRFANGSPNSQFHPRIGVINGRLSESSFRGYQKFKWLLNGSFRRLDLIAAQDQVYADRFIAMGCKEPNVIVTGSVKYDGVRTDRNNEKTRRLAKLANIQPSDIVFLAGSTQFEEELLATKVYLELVRQYPNLRLILAPRHPERTPQLIQALADMGVSMKRRSELIEGSDLESGSDPGDPEVPLIVDVIGELGAWWGVADIAYVGGSLGSRGGQNMIEPAAYGVPVSFGPNTKNFQIVVNQLLAVDAATVIHDTTDLHQFVERCLTDRHWGRNRGERAQREMLRHLGAADRTVEQLLCFFV